jgi:hypothetical protein
MRTVRICVLAAAILAAMPLLSRAADQPVAAPGPARRVLSVKDSPGYVPLVDPDSLAEKLGRRPTAKLVKEEFTGGGRSMEELGRLICRALHRDDPDTLMSLCVKSAEFRTILWPEFPQSRPATGLRWDDAWQILWGRLNGGSVSATREFGGHYYTFLKFDPPPKVVPYKNFKLHNGITIVAKSDDGSTQRFSFIRSIAERKGRFKIYSMSD